MIIGKICDKTLNQGENMIRELYINSSSEKLLQIFMINNYENDKNVFFGEIFSST
jgi:hypothetical protein